MNILNKILGIPHYPATFKGHTIDYNFAKDKCRYCGNIAYGAYANKSDIGRKVACLYYCPNCQKLFGIPKLSDPILVGKY